MNKCLSLIVAVALLIFTSCEVEKQDRAPWSKSYTLSILDSIAISDLMAGYNEEQGYTLIVKDDISLRTARKITKRVNFPFLVDSLVRVAPDEYRSKKYRFHYIITDSTVQAVYKEKIIHPSSNWQGQTPGQQDIVTTFWRRDIELK